MSTTSYLLIHGSSWFKFGDKSATEMVTRTISMWDNLLFSEYNKIVLGDNFNLNFMRLDCVNSDMKYPLCQCQVLEEIKY